MKTRFLLLSAIAFCSSANAQWQFTNGDASLTGNVEISGGISASRGFRVKSPINDVMNDAPWYGLGLSNLVINGNGSTAVQLAGYYGLNLQTAGGQMVVDGASGYVGIGTASPSQKLEVNGNIKTSGGFLSTAGMPIPAPGGLSIGNLSLDYSPLQSNWTTTGSTLLLSADNFTTIGFHDSNNRVDFIRSGSRLIQLGYDGGWGEANIGLPGGGIWNTAGNVGIGTTNPGQYKLAVEGMLGARKVVVTQTAWADYVFEPGYGLPSLAAVEAFVKQNKHLPEVPSAKEVRETGIDLGANQTVLLKKVEELTLYAIEQDKKQAAQQQLIADQGKLLLQLRSELDGLKQKSQQP